MQTSIILAGKNVLPSSFYYEGLQKCCHVKTSQQHSTRSSFGINFFDQQKGPGNSNKNNWATYTANKE